MAARQAIATTFSRTFWRPRGEILAAEAARFLGYDLEVIQPLLQRLVAERLARAMGPDQAGVYRWRKNSPLPNKGVGAGKPCPDRFP